MSFLFVIDACSVLYPRGHSSLPFPIKTASCKARAGVSQNRPLSTDKNKCQWPNLSLFDYSGTDRTYASLEKWLIISELTTKAEGALAISIERNSLFSFHLLGATLNTHLRAVGADWRLKYVALLSASLWKAFWTRVNSASLPQSIIVVASMKTLCSKRRHNLDGSHLSRLLDSVTCTFSLWWINKPAES